MLVAGEAMKAFPRSAIALRNVQGGVVRGLRREPPEGTDAPPAVDMQDCRDVRVLPAAPK